MSRTRRALFGTLVAVSAAAAACNLFIDADSLVGGDEPGAEAGTDGPIGDDGAVPDGTVIDDGGLLDGMEAGPTRPPPDGSVPGCVAPPPGDASTVAVTWGGILTPPACPAGYEPAPAVVAYADFDAGPAQCSAAGCVCAGPSGTATCSVTLSYYTNAACTAASGATPDPVNTVDCTMVQKGGGTTHARNGATVNAGGVTCPASGTPTTTKPAALWGTVVEGCRPAAGATVGSCGDGGLVPMPPVPSQALACYVSAGACASGYSQSYTFSSTLAIDDKRDCTCRCTRGVDANGCATGGALNLYSTNNCSGAAANTLSGAGCRPLDDYGNAVRLATAPTPAAGTVSCAPDAGPTGSATPSSPTVRLCCMNKCDVCRVNAGVPSGPCAAQYNACSADPDCATYRACITAQCGGVDCLACSSAVPDAGSITTYQAFATCRTTSCSSVCP